MGKHRSWGFEITADWGTMTIERNPELDISIETGSLPRDQGS